MNTIVTPVDVRHLIGGEWTGSPSHDRENPARPGEVVARISLGGESDVHAAIEAAERAFPAWRRTPAPARGAILARAAELLAARRESVARDLTSEEGKTIAEATGEVQRAVDIVRFFSGEGWRLSGESLPSSVPSTHLYTVKEPLGVVALVTPWNFPIAVPTWKIGPALVAGNTVVFKPSELTPWTSQLICEIFEEAGLPPGVLNLVHGTGPDAGQPLVDHPAIRAVSFTGSNPVGTAIARSCAARGAAAQCEMGGKNPIIVLADADLDLAAEGAAQGAFGSTGQRCTATSRAVVHASVADAFVEKVAAKLRAIRVGNGMDPASTIGPAVEEKQHRKVLSYVGIGREDGATLVAGGRDLRTEAGLEHGWFLEPALFDHVTPSMRIAQEEIFGPVVVIVPFEGEDEAVRLANDVRYGLAAGIWTRDTGRAHRVAHALEAGSIWVNHYGAYPSEAPFGGYKESGTGHDLGLESLNEYLETKNVHVNIGTERFDWYES